MQKVVWVIDGKHFSKGVGAFLKNMNDVAPVFITGLFLPSVEETELLYSLGGMTGPMYVPETADITEDEQKEILDEFSAFCTKEGFEFNIHAEPVDNVVTCLRKESRYADLMLIGNELFYNNLGAERQYEYLLHVLHNTECPVLLVPEIYEFPETAVITFDGSPSSVFAMKQFCCLFPYLTGLNTLLVYATLNGEFPDWNYISELAGRHFPNLVVEKLIAEPKKYFDSWLMDNKSPIVVSGAYSRSFISEVIRKSFILEVIKDHHAPVFIAHK